jgi:Asp-tRNA(Asn)/Glu-tRNA(Gln) amidotransferase A subunit family amidase
VGCPAMSVPIGTIDEKNAQGEIEKLPVWLQLMWPHRSEYRLFGVGRQIEEIMKGVV